MTQRHEVIHVRMAECGCCNIEYARLRLNYPLEAFGISPVHFPYIRSLTRFEVDMLLIAICESYEIEKGEAMPILAY